MQCTEAHAPCGITREALNRHIRHYIAAVLDVCSLAEGGIRTADVVVVTSDHNRTDFAAANHFVEFKRDIRSAFGILIEYARLCADNKLVCLCITNPNIVIAILRAAGRIDAAHCRCIGLVEILGLAGQADPAERTVAVVKQNRTHNILNITREDEAILFINAVLGDFLNAAVVNRFHEGVAVVEEIRAALCEGNDCIEMTAQRSIDSAFELVTIGMQHTRALIKGQTDGAITAVIDIVAGSLVGKQIDMDVMRNGIFKQIDNISVICDRNRFFLRKVLFCFRKHLVKVIGNRVYPALVITRFDS